MNPLYAHRPSFELEGRLDEVRDEMLYLQDERSRIERLAELQAEEEHLLRELRERNDADLTESEETR